MLRLAELRDGSAGRELDDEERPSVVIAGVKHAGNVGMVQPRECLSLEGEPIAQPIVHAGQQLDRDLALHRPE
ncbi:MAG: hypothetical protein AAGI46_03255, partial [Planctomycetota bacterium]